MVESRPSLQKGRVELLAPAGGLPAFFAALDAGADAVYCGLTSFSARARAKNFAPEDLPNLVGAAHAAGAKLYLALNTLIKERELPELVDTLARLEEARVDGLIVQDLGVVRLARRYFPNLSLHASTQMTVHNGAGVNVLAGLGFTRAVLARELSLAEIAAIRAESTLELEHFVHGALCFGISGLCLFSSFRSGKSGNRGRCEQLCRRRYLRERKPGYYFSTADFNAIELLPQLIEAGISSLKIEGRMKNAEYVGRVVKAYRLVLDARPDERGRVLAEARDLLALTYGRAETSGYLTGRRDTVLPPPERQGSMGSRLGMVEKIRGGRMEMTLSDRLHLGDRIKLLPPDDRIGAGLTVRSLSVGNKPVKQAGSGVRVAVDLPKEMRAVVGSAVFKMGGREEFALSEEACRRKLAAVRPAPAPLTLEIAVGDRSLEISGEAAGVKLKETYSVETSPARSTPLDEAILTRTFGKTGGHPLELKGLTAQSQSPVVIPPSRLNEIRRDFYGRLDTAREEAGKLRLEAIRRQVFGTPPASVPGQPRESMVRLADYEMLPELDLPANVEVLLPLDKANLEAVSGKGLEPGLIWEVPALVFPGDWSDLVGLVKAARNTGYFRFMLDNIGHLELFPETEGLELLGGSHLYAMNSQAALAWRELGLAALTLALEDDRDNLRDLRSRLPDLPAWLVVFAPVPLLISRIPLAGKEGEIILGGEGKESLRLHHQRGLTLLEDHRPFSLLPYLEELKSMGYRRFRIDLGKELSSIMRRQILLALFTGDSPKVPGGCGNYVRGLE